jgi:4,5:9,10-diseco-3-hydroxy-5,9,17-trioxoandrosta-1(10),2-diene-4-oate hydrolase
VRHPLPRAVAALLGVAGFLGALTLHDRPPAVPGSWLAASGLAARYETVGGHRLRYVRAGSGPPAVLVHGFASSLYTWKDVIPALAARHDVVALDLPGFGQSDQPADLSFEDFPRAVLGLMERLGIRRAALVGNSMGGATAAVVAAQEPDRVTALVLIDAAGFNLGASERPAMVSVAMSRTGSLFAHLPGKRLVVEASLRQVLHDDLLVTPERVSEYLAAAARPGTFPAIRSLGASLRDRATLVAEALPRVQAPTLVLWGDDDRWIPLAHADRFVAAIPGSRKVVIPACGHVPQEESPGEVARLLLGFLEQAATR